MRMVSGDAAGCCAEEVGASTASSTRTAAYNPDFWRIDMYRRFLPIAILVVWAAGPSSAQWLKHPDPRVPRTVDGKPNLTAPAPHLPDGKPDFSGLWNAVDGRFLTNISRRAGVEPPFQPWAKKLFDERQANEGRDR